MSFAADALTDDGPGRMLLTINYGKKTTSHLSLSWLLYFLPYDVG